MKLYLKFFLLITLIAAVSPDSRAQNNLPHDLPSDYLSPGFHAGRRQALRQLMPPNSVAVIFAYPERVYSRDVNYAYHPNPDLYYFSGYKEPNGMLLIFKEMQHDARGDYNEVFFVQKRDVQREQANGRRLGVEGVKAQLGFGRVYNGEDFPGFDVDLKKFGHILYASLPQDVESDGSTGTLKNLVSAFIAKSGIKPANEMLQRDLKLIAQYASPQNLSVVITFLKPRMQNEDYKNDPDIGKLMDKPDSATLIDVQARANARLAVTLPTYITQLRGIKTPEELVLLKKAITISAIAHAEAMRAVKPEMSEHELEGIMLFVHQRYGAEDEGYPPIVGAGSNGCILHYENNDALRLNNQLVLMDVGAVYHGYTADVTRTFPANGKFTPEQKAIYQLVYNAQEEVFKLCREGVPYDKLEDKTVEVLANGLLKLGIIKDKKEVRTYYPHGVSHHIGLDVHDVGAYGVPLKSNMVITVEPGIYIPAGSPCDKKWWDIGVRIEDDVLVGKDKGTVLSTDAPRSWQDVEKTIAEKSIFDGDTLPVLK